MAQARSDDAVVEGAMARVGLGNPRRVGWEGFKSLPECPIYSSTPSPN
jgi:hypothetical protein